MKETIENLMQIKDDMQEKYEFHVDQWENKPEIWKESQEGEFYNENISLLHKYIEIIDQLIEGMQEMTPLLIL